MNFFLIPFFQDFHCHLTSSEVVGYLGGRWDTNTQRELPLTSLTLTKKDGRNHPAQLRLGSVPFSAHRLEGLPLPDQAGRQGRGLRR